MSRADSIAGADPSWADAARDTVGSWREMFVPATVPTNIAAGVAVAMVAIPLNLALAVACGLPPASGLVTGAVAGLIGALFGGSRLNITGPEVALAPLTALIVATHGIQGMIVATVIAGLIQIGLGLFRVGGIVRAIPRPVVGGFLAAVGLLVFNSQLPHLIGLHDGRTIGQHSGDPAALLAMDVVALAIGAGVIVALVAIPKLVPRVPAPLVGLAVAVGITAWLGLGIERVEPIAAGALSFALPDLGAVDLGALLPSALALAALASVDSLLCAVSIDARIGGARHRPDQELVAQGVANIASALFGGMPVASAVVRSVAAIEACGSTRLCGAVQSVVLFGVVLVLGPHLDLVPIAALSGVLLVVGARLIDVRELRILSTVRRFDAFLFVATAIAIVWTGFVEGIVIGTGIALVALARANGAALRARAHTLGDLRIARLEGPLVFSSQARVAEVLASACGSAPTLRIDLSGVCDWDASGLAGLRSYVARLAAEGRRVQVATGGALPTFAVSRELGANATVRASFDEIADDPRSVVESATIIAADVVATDTDVGTSESMRPSRARVVSGVLASDWAAGDAE
ncbi:MAG: SulP family inorganic anion transporter [Myxococcota bacterium]|nr:SulP family inorganic anion transporter [Myxococcota bacterium]